MNTEYKIKLSETKWRANITEAIGIAKNYSVSNKVESDSNNYLSCFGNQDKDIYDAINTLRKGNKNMNIGDTLNVNEFLDSFYNSFTLYRINFLDDENKYDALLFLYKNTLVLVSRIIELSMEIRKNSISENVKQQVAEELLFYNDLFDIELDDFFCNKNLMIEYTVNLESFKLGELHDFVNIEPEVSIREGQGFQSEILSKKIPTMLVELDSFFKEIPLHSVSSKEIHLAESFINFKSIEMIQTEVLYNNIEIVFLDNLDSRVLHSEKPIDDIDTSHLHETILEIFYVAQNNISNLCYLLLGIIEVHRSTTQLDKMNNYLEAATYLYSIYHEKITETMMSVKDKELTYSIIIMGRYNQYVYIEEQVAGDL